MHKKEQEEIIQIPETTETKIVKLDEFIKNLKQQSLSPIN